MTITQIALALAAHKNTLTFTVTLRRDAKTYKGTIDHIEKLSTVTGLFADYAELSPVVAGIEAGIRSEPELPKHIARSENIGGTRFWVGHNGKYYLPVCLADVPQVAAVWFLNGHLVDRSQVENLLTAAERPTVKTTEELAEKGQARFIAILVENIVAVSAP